MRAYFLGSGLKEELVVREKAEYVCMCREGLRAKDTGSF